MSLPPVTESFDPGALLGRSYVLASNQRVRLRLPHIRDRDGIRVLFDQAGAGIEDFELAQLLRFDPRRRLVFCATELIGSAETVVGVGAIDLDQGQLLEPDLLLVAGHIDGPLLRLLRNALVGRAKAIARKRAA